MSASDGREFVTTAQFAKINGVSVFTVWRWIREGHVEAQKCPNGYSWRVRLKKSTAQLPATATDSE